jgi:DNA-binding response OmpR family regulator
MKNPKWVYTCPVRILLLEDDPTIRASLGASLREAGFVVDQAERALEAEGLTAAFEFDALIVDVRLPEGPDAGFEFVERLRANGIISPVLFLTARDGLRDRITGLDAGGDDYLTKPFALEEVHARLRALLRRSRPNPTNLLERGEFTLDFATRRVMMAGNEIHLTAKEFGILELLASSPGRVFSRSEIADRVWGVDFEAETNVVDVYVKNLRRKVGAWVIETLVNVGYRFPER